MCEPWSNKQYFQIGNFINIYCIQDLSTLTVLQRRAIKPEGILLNPNDLRMG